MSQVSRHRNCLVWLAIALGLYGGLQFLPSSSGMTALAQVLPISPLRLSALAVPIKIVLRGPYNTSSQLMNDTLRVQNLLPTGEPYSTLPQFAHAGGEVVDPSVFTVTGNDAIVDWVLVELRSASNATQILATRAALVQRDGDVVDTDGSSPLAFASQSPGNYYVAVGHRNHLRVMTANPIPVDATTILVDFTDPNTPTYGTQAQATVGNVRTLWPGDAATDSQVVYSGPANDRNVILIRVLTAPGNAQFSSNFIVNGYEVTDLNLDGKTIAAGPNNEMNVLLATILMHPSNSNQSSNYIIREQVPTGVLVLPTPIPTATSTPVSPLPTPTKVFTLPTSIPNIAVYIIDDEDFLTELSLAEKQARWDQGQPVPDIASAVENRAATRSFKPGLLAPMPLPLAQSNASWTTLYSENFDSGFPAAGKRGECQLELLSSPTGSGYLWGGNNFRTHDSSPGAAWPYRGGSAGVTLTPGTATYPENITTQIICTFSNLSQAKNLLADFAFWQDQADNGDLFFVGFHTGEKDSNNKRLFRGLTWGSSNNASGTPEWKQIRMYYPAVGAKAGQNNGEVAIMWQFASDGTRNAQARGAWLDSIKIERYVQPTSSVGCENLATSSETKISVPGAPSGGMVSKGLNLPPDSDDNTWRLGLDPALITRLTEAETNWVRLEFEVQPSAFLRLQDATTLRETIDLKHYDLLIDALCANKIAVLGLLTYQSVADQSWKAEDGQGQISVSYLNTFTRTTSILVDYYNDRIDAWEIWNEPDYKLTGLAPAEFAKLLLSNSSIIHAAHDVVVFGGLANVDRLSTGYFRQFYAALENLGSPATPYDVFALHPYPSYEYVGSNGQLLVDPQSHWRKESPTVLTKFQNIMRGDNALNRNDSAKEIWVTEFGWNGAKGSPADVEDRCVTLEAQWVTAAEQAIYVGTGLDILFKETTWPGENRAAVTKAFLYQYQDTSSPFAAAECTVAPTYSSPSWWLSWFWQLIYAPDPQQSVAVPWSFGLHDGNLQPKAARCTFQHYPEWVNGCYDLDYFVHLPAIRAGQTATAAGE